MEKTTEDEKNITKTKKRPSNKKLFAYTMIGVFTLIFIFSAIMLVIKLLEYKEGNDKYNDIKDTAVIQSTQGKKYLSVDSDVLKKINSDYMGWLDIPDMGISYPVVYADDYEEYIHTAFDGNYLYAGTIFSDFQCKTNWGSRNTILYGHNMKDGSMFGRLKKYLDKYFFEAHKNIYVYVKDSIYVYEAFSVYTAVAADESYTVDFSNDNAFIAWVDVVINKSAVSAETNIKEDDKVLMLSTCVSSESNDRLVVFAVLKDIIKNQ